MPSATTAVIGTLGAAFIASVVGPIALNWYKRRRGPISPELVEAQVRATTVKTDGELIAQLTTAATDALAKAKASDEAGTHARDQWVALRLDYADLQIEVRDLVDKLRRVTSQRDAYGEALDEHHIPRPG